MAKATDPSHENCPTFPGGVCPPINTRPTFPQPDDERIEKAAERIPDVLAQEFKRRDRIEAVASELVAQLGTAK